MAPSVRVIPTPNSSLHEKTTVTNKNSHKASSTDNEGRIGLAVAAAAAASTNSGTITTKPTTTTMMTKKKATTFEKGEAKQNQINHGDSLARTITAPETASGVPSSFTSSMPSSMYPMSYPATPNAGSLYQGNMYYGGSGGMGMYGMMSPYSGMYPPTVGPLATWNQYVMGIQNFVFSVGQVVQVVSMNAQAIQQLLHTTKALLERAWTTYRELRVLELQQEEAQSFCRTHEETEENRKRRRRLKALRWTAMTIVLYITCRVIFRMVSNKRRRRRVLNVQEG